MDKKSYFSSDISIDSLEIECKKKSPIKKKDSEENVDTILVPFYEKDVLIKVPKRKKKHVNTGENNNKNEVNKKEQSRNYLMNNSKKGKKMSYLEMFRQQFICNCTEKLRKDPNEIRSISPEFGDTERESIGEDCNNNIVTEFYNTESYNEIYYEKLMKQELKQYLDQSFEEIRCFNEDIDGKSLIDEDENNLRSVSEISRPRRPLRRTSVPPLHNVRLGGLGPDIENIKPRLERAKSLQRYSEKVRMENRLKIYKKAVEAENEKKAERELSARRRDLIQPNSKEQKTNKTSTYLVNKAVNKHDSKSMLKKLSHPKCRSNNDQKYKEKGKLGKDTYYSNADSQNVGHDGNKSNRIIERNLLSAKENLQKYVKSNDGSVKAKSSARSQGINTDIKQNNEASPVQISFLVNVGGLRPSSALKSLEEKHRMYQERVKDFTNNMEPNNI